MRRRGLALRPTVSIDSRILHHARRGLDPADARIEPVVGKRDAEVVPGRLNIGRTPGYSGGVLRLRFAAGIHLWAGVVGPFPPDVGALLYDVRQFMRQKAAVLRTSCGSVRLLLQPVIGRTHGRFHLHVVRRRISHRPSATVGPGKRVRWPGRRNRLLGTGAVGRRRYGSRGQGMPERIDPRRAGVPLGRGLLGSVGLGEAVRFPSPLKHCAPPEVAWVIGTVQLNSESVTGASRMNHGCSRFEAIPGHFEPQSPQVNGRGRRLAPVGDRLSPDFDHASAHRVRGRCGPGPGGGRRVGAR